jgi:hypothetical protein
VKDLREMKGKRWQEKAVDREEWASVIEEANALRESYSQAVTN